MRILILGYGRSGKAVEALAKALGHATHVLDGDQAVWPEGEFDLAVVSPGIALTHPWIAACREKGIPFESELQFGCEELKRRGWKLLAVTGSKGKSSVVKVVAEGIAATGVRAVPCGNYGVCVSEIALSEPVGWAVVEVSSFMMETTKLPRDTFEAAAILNLQEDHLDRHGNVETYHGLKRALLGMAVRPIDMSQTSEWEDEKSAFAGSYFDNSILAANGAASVRLMRAAGLNAAAARRAFVSFQPLPHRMNDLGMVRGVRCIDDSKATSLAALAAGVTMAGSKIRLIAGGLAKGDDPNSVISPLTERVKKVYLIGRCAEVFFAAWSDHVACQVSGTLENAVRDALHDAEEGETLLLSPGTASFDQFKSFGERGEVFANLVNKERQ